LGGAGPPTRGPSRRHRPRAGERPECALEERSTRARRLVHRPSEHPARSLDPGPDGVRRPEWARCPGRARHQHGVHGFWAMRFLIVGAAGHAQEVAWSLREQEACSGRSCDILFFDDAVAKGPVASGLGDVVGTLADLRDWTRRADGALVLGIGLPGLKREVAERLAPLRLPWATVVHPAATVGPNCRIGEGSYLAAGSIVTVNCTIGRFVTINMHCQVAHDDVLEDLVTLHPDTHLGGNVRVGAGAELGTGSIVTPGLTIGARAVLGAGCTVVRSLQGDSTYVGVPAAPVMRRARATGGSFAR